MAVSLMPSLNFDKKLYGFIVRLFKEKMVLVYFLVLYQPQFVFLRITLG